MGRSSQIIAMGGGGFSMEPDNLSLDRFILSVTGVDLPKICFLPTASGDAQGYIDRFYTSFNSLPCIPSHLSLFKLTIADLRSFLLGQDVVYVGGGSTRNMLVLWREWGLDSILHEACQSGVTLAGLSAGSLCWFQQGVTDSAKAGDLQPMDCLGFLPGSHCPHYNGEPGRRPAYERLIREEKLAPGYAADDGAALHFVDKALVKVVSSRPRAQAYHVRWNGRQIEETTLATEFLSSVTTQT